MYSCNVSRHFAALASRKEDYEFLAKVLNGCDCIPGLVLDTDLRWQLVIALAEGGYADEARIKAELLKLIILLQVNKNTNVL